MDSLKTARLSNALRLDRARILRPDGRLETGSLTVAEGLIADDAHPALAHAADLDGLLVLPGIVDIHGDAFERQVMPRPGVSFPLDLALTDTDRQLVANGITTAYHGLTWSWEPGLRSGDAARAFLAALRRLRVRLAADTRVHLRWETFNLDAVVEIEAAINAGDIALLAFNNHLPGDFEKRHDQRAMSKMADRSGVTVARYVEMLCALEARRDEVPVAVRRLAAVARKAGVALLSHDDETPEFRREMNALGCTVAEFPITETTAQTARDLGNATVFGAPNVVRGGSHTRAVRAADMVEKGLCTVLASDYYYPSLLAAPFVLAREGALSFDAAWDLVAANPAAACGLADRGKLEPGRRADLIVVDDSDPLLPCVVATMVAGRFVYRSRGVEGDSLPLSNP